ncbi:MAG: nuclear transport factor 2 family protein [Phycisphaerales bacterium JB043]
MGTHNRLESLVEAIKGGDIMGAFEEFYDENVSMQENTNPPTLGKEANRAREQQFLDSVKEWKSLSIDAHAVEEMGDGAVSFIEYQFEFVNNDNQPVHYQQVAVQRWRGGKVVAERFYYGTE